MKVSYQLRNQVLESDEMVDVMNVAGKLRWANRSGEQNQAEAGPLMGLRSGDPCMVVVKQEGETLPFRSVKFAETDPDEGTVYMAAPGWVHRTDGEIVRIRNQTI